MESSGARGDDRSSPEEVEERIFHMTSAITPPVLIEKVQPRYPRLDSQLGFQGRVILLIIIEKDGTVQHAKVLRSVNVRIDKAALDAVKRWTYRPARLNGRPVRMTQVVGMHFEMSRR
jgi:protein TonB